MIVRSRASFIFLLVLPIVILASHSARAHRPEGGKITVAAGPLSLVSYGLRHAVDKSPLYGFALIVLGDVDENGGVEVAAMPMRKMYFIEREGQKTIESSTRLQITSGYRHWFTSWLSGGLGLFSSYVMGEAAEIGTTVGERVNTSAHDAVEYGFEASIQLEAFRHEKFSGLLDMRYSHSVTPKGGEEGNHFAAIIAIKYEVQERGQPDP